jgi:hypothetical protein
MKLNNKTSFVKNILKISTLATLCYFPSLNAAITCSPERYKKILGFDLETIITNSSDSRFKVFIEKKYYLSILINDNKLFNLYNPLSKSNKYKLKMFDKVEKSSNLTDEKKTEAIINSIQKYEKNNLSQNITASPEVIEKIKQYTSYDIKTRYEYLDKKTFSYGEFHPDDSRFKSKKLLSISGEEFHFNKPTEEYIKQLSDLNDPEISDKIEILKLLKDENFILVNNNSLYKTNSEKTLHIPPQQINFDESSLSTVEFNKILKSNDFAEYKNFTKDSSVSDKDLVHDIFIISKFDENIKDYENNNSYSPNNRSRYNDAEFKLINEFISLYDNKYIPGKLTIYTSKPACVSCTNGYESFLTKTENQIRLEIITIDDSLFNELNAKTKFPEDLNKRLKNLGIISKN